MGERLRDVAHYRDEAEHRAETVACAKRANLSPSEYVRECVRAANRAMPAPSPTRDELTRAELTAVNLASSALLRATEATNRQGQLLNQLMPKWHRLGERIVWPELAEAVASNGAGGQRAAGGDRRGRRRAVGGDAAATAVIWQAEKLGSHTGGLVRYLLGREAVGEMAHVNQRVVDGYRDDLDSKTVRELAELLDAEVRESGKPGRHVYHLIGATGRAADGHPVEPMSDAQAAEMTRDALRRLRLIDREDQRDARWALVRHDGPDDPHWHVVVTLAAAGKRIARPRNDYYRLRDAAQAAERRYGLRPTPDAGKGNPVRTPTRGEVEKAKRLDWPITEREALHSEARREAAQATSAADFAERMQARGREVVIRDNGRQASWKVRGPSGLWFGGGALSREMRDLHKILRAGESIARSVADMARSNAQHRAAQAELHARRTAPHGMAGDGPAWLSAPAKGQRQWDTAIDYSRQAAVEEPLLRDWRTSAEHRHEPGRGHGLG